MANNDAFIVLALDEDEPARELDQRGPRRGGPRAAPAAIRAAAKRSNVAVEVRKLDSEDLKKIDESPRHFSARPMPIRLIRPKARAKAKASAVLDPVQWGVTAVGADKAGGLTGDGVVVAVLDTGITEHYRTHPAFAGMDIVVENFTDEADHDTDGHGTHCAGTIFGREVNGTRIGVAPGVKKALIGKILGKHGGTTDAIVRAIQWAVDEGAHVISMSLGIDFPGMVERMRAKNIPGPRATSEALAAYRDTVRLFDKLSAFLQSRAGLNESSVVLVGAAGNESNRPKFTIDCAPPAKAEGILPVAAVDSSLRVASFSNTGALVAGPGVNIVSASLDGGLAVMSGTSMAAPHVAGVAALWTEHLMKRGELDGGQGVLRNLTARAKRLDDLDFVTAGHGLVQAP